MKMANYNTCAAGPYEGVFKKKPRNSSENHSIFSIRFPFPLIRSISVVLLFYLDPIFFPSNLNKKRPQKIVYF